MALEYKIIKDPVHGTVKLHPLLVKIIDTPQFQRLRHIKILGACVFVYPGASHTRFEHCIGTAYLANKLLKNLRDNSAEHGRTLDDVVTDEDRLCLEIAALCHDLGALPYGLALDKCFEMFLHENPKMTAKGQMDYSYRAMTMFQHLYKKNNLEGDFKRFFTRNLDKNLLFIKELIFGSPLNGSKNYGGRVEDNKKFLYKIIRNCQNGVDIHKWDYLTRNSKGLDISISLDVYRFLECVQVDEKFEMIMIPIKLHNNLFALFSERQLLCRTACQHKTVIAIEYMIADIFWAAEKAGLLPFPGSKVTLMECLVHGDMEALTNLKDSILDIIRFQASSCQHEEAHKVLNLFEFLDQRKLYRQGYFKKGPLPQLKTDPYSKDRYIGEILSRAKSSTKLKSEDVFIHITCFDYGNGQDNPIKMAYFYDKKNPFRRTQMSDSQMSLMYPKTFQEYQFHFYVKFLDLESRREAEECCLEWYRTISQSSNVEDHSSPKEITPTKVQDDWKRSSKGKSSVSKQLTFHDPP